MASFFPPSGPQLPKFKSILVKGPYHPTAPIHLALSFVAQHPANPVLFLTPSRDSITIALQNYEDELTANHSTQIQDLATLSRIQILHESFPSLFLTLMSHISYPPTPAHLAFLLAILHTATDDEDSSNAPTFNLNLAPSVVILHGLSAYFSPSPETSWTLSSYMTLVARTIASLASLSAHLDASIGIPHISLALFDSDINRLKLPVLNMPPTPNYGLTREEPPGESVAPLISRFFEWTAVFETRDEHSKRLQLYKYDIPDILHSWTWLEMPTQDGRSTTIFDWDP